VCFVVALGQVIHFDIVRKDKKGNISDKPYQAEEVKKNFQFS
jgi:hypothetical protein